MNSYQKYNFKYTSKFWIRVSETILDNIYWQGIRFYNSRWIQEFPKVAEIPRNPVFYSLYNSSTWPNNPEKNSERKPDKLFPFNFEKNPKTMIRKLPDDMM